MSSYQQTMGSYEGSSYARAFPAQYNAELPQADGQLMSVQGIPGEVSPELPKADPFRQLKRTEASEFVNSAIQNRLQRGSLPNERRSDVPPNGAYDPQQDRPRKPKTQTGRWLMLFAVFLALIFILMMVLAAWDYPYDERDGRRFGRFRRLCRIE